MGKFCSIPANDRPFYNVFLTVRVTKCYKIKENAPADLPTESVNHPATSYRTTRNPKLATELTLGVWVTV